MMGGTRARAVAALLLALLAVAAVLAPAMGNPGGNEEKNYQLCGNSPKCHGFAGTNSSVAQVSLSTDRLVLWAGQPNVSVRVDVTGAEQRSNDWIGVLLLRDLVDPLFSHPRDDGWTLLEDPKGRTPGYNYAKKRAQGPSGDTSASFVWRLQAPAVPGDYRLYARMHTGVDEEDATPLLREEELTFRVVPLPRVEDNTPRDGAMGVFVNTPAVLVFSKEMDRPSVEAAFDISPHVNGTFTWEGTVARFNVEGFLAEGTTYTLTLDTTARDADGIRLREALEVTFTTGSGVDVYPPRVVSVVSSRAPLDAVVRVAFDEPMDRASVEAAFSIAPAVVGRLAWEGRVLVFTPSAPLDYDTLYTVRISPTAQDLNGNALAAEVRSAFLTVRDTDPPEVLYTSPSPGAKDVPLVARVVLRLSGDVDPDTLGGALSWDPPVLADVQWNASNATLVPRHPLEEGTLYNLTVGTGLLDARGNPLAEPFLLSFTTAGSADRTPPALEDVSPGPGSRVSTRGSVRLTFSETMDRDSVEAAIMVSPVAEASYSWDGRVLTVSFERLEAGRVYTINLATTMTDLAGNAPRGPYVLRFVAAPEAGAEEQFFYVEDWLETWWDLALLAASIALVAALVAVQLRWGWRRVAMTAFAWVEERVRTARYLGQARMLYYSVNRQMPHSHAEGYGSKTVWYWYPFYCLGGIALLSFIICCVSGLVLGLYYEPSAEGSPSVAYQSVETIMEDVSFGFMFRAIHHWSANIMIAAAFLHMARVYFTGAYRNPRELNWVVGVVLLGITLFFGYSGYLLPWNQLSYWAGTIGLEMCRAVPLVGDWFAELVFGGVTLGAATLTRMYFLHVVVLPAFCLGLMAVHLLAVYIQGAAEPH